VRDRRGAVLQLPQTVMLLIAAVVALGIVALIVWDASRSWRRSKEARRLDSLGSSETHREARWQDDDDRSGG